MSENTACENEVHQKEDSTRVGEDNKIFVILDPYGALP